MDTNPKGKLFSNAIMVLLVLFLSSIVYVATVFISNDRNQMCLIPDQLYVKTETYLLCVESMQKEFQLIGVLFLSFCLILIAILIRYKQRDENIKDQNLD